MDATFDSTRQSRDPFNFERERRPQKSAGQTLPVRGSLELVFQWAATLNKTVAPPRLRLGKNSPAK